MREGRIERLRAEGLVVEGDYSSVNTVNISMEGTSQPLAVRSQFISERNETVFFPLGTMRQSSDETDDPVAARYAQEKIWRAEEMHAPQALQPGVETSPINPIE